MSDQVPSRRRRVRRRSTLLSISSVDVRRIALLALLPIALCVAHAAGGANSTLGALWLTALLAASLSLATGLPSRSAKVMQSQFLLLIGGPFAITLAVAAWTVFGKTYAPLNEGLVAVSLPRAPSIDRSATVVEIVKLLGLGCAFLVGCIQGSTVKRAVITANALVVTGGLYAVFAFGLYFSGNQVRAGNRLTAGLLSANSAATLFGVLTVIAVALLLRDIGGTRSGVFDRARLAILASSAVILAAALTFTASRTGIAVTGLALVSLGVFHAVSRRTRFDVRSIGWVRAGAVAVGLAAVAAVVQIMLARSVTVEVDAANRAVIFASHWRAFLASPVFGHGLGTFVTINDMVVDPNTYGALWSIRAAHNVYIQWLEEAGILGSLPMFASVSACIGVTLLNARNAGISRTLIVGFLLADVVVFLHGTTDYALQVPSIAATWAFLLGLQCALSQASRIKPSR